MSWAARIEHTPDGIALTFGAPLARLDMAPEVAEHLASLLAVEARRRLAGVVSTLAAETGSHAVVVRRQAAQGVGLLRSVDNCENTHDYGFLTTVEENHPLCCDCLDCMNGIRENDHA